MHARVTSLKLHVRPGRRCQRIAKAQSDRLVNVPLAPELGLFLDKAFYDSYNRRWGNDREPLDLDDFGAQVAPSRCAGSAALTPAQTIPIHFNHCTWLYVALVT